MQNTQLKKPRYYSDTVCFVLTNTRMEVCWQLLKSFNAPLFYGKHKWKTHELRITTQTTLFCTNLNGLSFPAHNFPHRWKGERRVYIIPRVTIHSTSCIDRTSFVGLVGSNDIEYPDCKFCLWKYITCNIKLLSNKTSDCKPPGDREANMT
jgi:hypothetical protein